MTFQMNSLTLFRFTNSATCILLLCFFSCHDQSNKKAETERASPAHILTKTSDTCSFSLRENAQICDTCWSTLIVRHDECTACLDLFVDSGTVYLDHQTIHYFDSLAKTRRSDQEIPAYNGLINTVDLLLENPKDYRRLWKFPEAPDLYKRYRVKGKVTGPKNTYSLQFKMTQFTLLNSASSSRFDR